MNAYWKAILAALSAGGASLVASGVALPPWVTAVLSALVALGVVTAVPNAGFVNLNKIKDPTALAVHAFGAYRHELDERGDRSLYGTDWSNLTADQQAAWRASQDAVVSQLRR
jgi:hypothetical protein